MAEERDLSLGTIFTADISQFETAIRTVRQQINELYAEMQRGAQRATQPLAGLTSAQQKAVVAAGKVKAATEEAGKAQTWIGKQIASVKGGWERLGAAMKVTASYGIAATAIYKVVDAVQAGVQEIIEYDQALKNLQAITGATGGELAAMGDKIREVARSTKFSVAEVADGMVLLGQAGFDAGESIDTMQAVADLATGTLTNLALTTDLLTTAIRAFGLESFQATQVSDIFANAINKSKLTVDKLRIAFNYIGPAANAAGADLEEVAAAMMTLANSGLRASTIGTGLRQVFSRLVAPTAKLREAFEANNITLEDLDIQAHGFSGVLENLTEMFIDAETGITDSRKAFELFGLRGANAILALVKAIQTGDYKKSLDSVYEVGTAANMAAIQIEGLVLKIKNLKDRAKELAIELGEGGLTRIIGLIVDSAKYIIVQIRKLVETPIGKVIANFLQWTAAVYGLVFAIGSLHVGISKLATILTTRLLIPLFTTWTGAAIVAIGALATAYVHWRTAVAKQVEKLQKQRIEIAKNIDVLDDYAKRLKEAADEREKDASAGVKYDRMLERLARDFDKIADAVRKAGGDFEKVEEIIREYQKTLSEQQVKKIGEIIQKQNELIEQEKLVQGIAVAATKAKAWAIKWFLMPMLYQYKNTLATVLILWAKFFSVFPGMAKNLGVNIEKLADYIYKLEQNLKDMGETSKEVQGRMQEQTQSVEDWVQSLFDRYKRGLITTQQIQREIETLAPRWGIPFETAGRALQRVLRLIRDYERAMKETELLPKLGREEDIFGKLFAQAAERNKKEVAEMIRQMQTAKSAFKKFAQEQKLSAEATSAGLADINVEYYKKIAELVHEEISLEWKKNKEIARSMQELKAARDADYAEQLRVEARNYDRRIARAGDNANKIKTLEKRKAEVLNKIRKQQAAEERIIAEEILLIRKEYLDDEIAYYDEQRATYLRQQLDAAIQDEQLKGIKRKQYAEEAAKNIAEMELDYAKEMFEQRKRDLEIIRAIYGEESDEFVTARERMLAAQKDLNAAIIEQAEATAKAREKEVKRKLATAYGDYKTGEITAQQYFDLLKEARDLDLINEEEYQREKALISGNYWDAVKQGIKDAQKEIKTFQELIYDITMELPRMFADNFIDAMDEVIDKTKSFGEAMAQMFANIAKMIADAIMQLLIMQAITSAMKGFFGGAGGGTSTATGTSTGAVSGAGTLRAHTGGIPGKDPLPVRLVNPAIFANAPRLHEGWSGLKKNEFPAILEKDEGVFTPAQMKALGQRGNVTVNVPVNVAGMDDKMLASKLRSNIEDTVLKTLREEMR